MTKHMTNPFDKREGFDASKSRDMSEADPFANISIDQIKADLEAKGIRWDFVEAAVAMWKNTELMTNLRRLKTSVAENPTHDQIARSASAFIDVYISGFMAGNNRLPIGGYDFVDDNVVDYLSRKVADALLAQ